MLIFLDESGDPGFKVRKGSTYAFVVILVIFDDELDAERTALAIKELRRDLGKSDKFEFKFNKCNRQLRSQFLSIVARFRFRIRGIVMIKERIYGEELRRSKESFYNYTVKSVLKDSFGRIENARLRIDKSGDRMFRQALANYLKRELRTQKGLPRTVKDIKFVDSKENVLAQLADMVAGAIRRCYSREKTNAKLYRGIIERRIENIWEFGR